MASEAFLYVQEKCHISIFIYPLHSFSDVMSISYCTHFPFYQITLHLFCIILGIVELSNFETVDARRLHVTNIQIFGHYSHYRCRRIYILLDYCCSCEEKEPGFGNYSISNTIYGRYQKNISSFRIILGYSSYTLEYDLRCELLITQCLYLIYSKQAYYAFLQLMVLYIRIRTNLKQLCKVISTHCNKTSHPL